MATPAASKHYEVHFNALPSFVRRRLVDLLNTKDGLDGPVVSQRTTIVAAFLGPAVLLAGAIGGLAWLMATDFASSYDPVQSGPWVVAYVAVMMVILGIGMWIARIARNRRRLPIRPGEYLLPMCVVQIADATDDLMTVDILTGITAADLTHHFSNHSYTRSTITFQRDGAKPVTITIRGQERAVEARRLWIERREVIQEIVRTKGATPDVLQCLFLDDPFVLMSDENWQIASRPATPLMRDNAGDAPMIPAWGRVLARPGRNAVLIGAVAGMMVWGGRNVWSDETVWQMVRPARLLGDLELYAERGWLHRDEARGLIPRAALNAAMVRGPTVTELRTIVKTYGGQAPDVAADANATIHRLFDDSRAKLRTRLTSALSPCPKDLDAKDDPTAEDDAHLLTTVLAIIDHLESHSDVHPALVFVRPPGEELDRVDKELLIAAKVDHPLVQMAPMAPAFSATASVQRENQIAHAITRALDAILPQGVLDLDRQNTIPTDRPVVAVGYVIAASGSIYIDTKTERRGFGGIQVDFALDFRVPGTATARFLTQVQPPQRFSVGTWSRFGVGGGASDATVYDTMAERAFDRFAAVICRRFHQAPPPPGSELDSLPSWMR